MRRAAATATTCCAPGAASTRRDAAPRARSRCSSTTRARSRSRWRPRPSHGAGHRGSPARDSGRAGVAAAARAAPGRREERCELCGEPIPPEHRHLLDLDDARAAVRLPGVLAAVRPPGGRRRALPARPRPPRCASTTSSSTTPRGRSCASRSTWRSSSTARAEQRVVAFYPSPMGPTESLLELDAWEALEAANPVLAELEPDVEALLVNRARGARRALARADRRLLRARRPDPHALARLRPAARRSGRRSTRFFDELDRRARRDRAGEE